MTMIGPVMLDVASTKLQAEDEQLIASDLCGGLILFARNFESAEQVFELTSAIKAIKPNIIIAVDQEGGRVQRFKDGFSILPPLASLGRLYQNDPQLSREFAADLGELMALEIQSVGCDISFAPVLDLGFQESRVIGDRAFSTDGQVISEIGSAYISGMRNGGMAATAKHFPGHGSIEADSHFEIPYDERGFAEIEQNDLVPFANLKEQYAAVMPAHIIYSQVDEHPAGFSSAWLQTILRQKVGFDGVIFSDDLSMKGAHVAGNFAQRAERALSAGCDMVLVCNDREATEQVMDSLADFKQSELSSNRLQTMQMQSKPQGLATLKQTERWQYLADRLQQFNGKQGI